MADYALRRTMMVDTQVRTADVTSFPLLDAMLRIPRERFVPDALRETAYVGENIPLGPRRVVLEPRTQAKLLEALDIQPGDLVLDLAPGLGYSTAVIAVLAEAVVAVEPDADMAREAQAALVEVGADNATVETGDPTLGAPAHGPYDAIVVEGAVQRVPDSVIDQLAEGGRIGCIFMQGSLGVARVGVKTGGQVSWRYAFNASAPVLEGFDVMPEFTL
ncbi:protein-L-isoaspartate O-methyltransferase family protein [Oceaniovalibus guishaninsula]|nr:protein-L-isoaspartate O-methyltransferase [Oceaniovalibus guishaninsula]